MDPRLVSSLSAVAGFLVAAILTATTLGIPFGTQPTKFTAQLKQTGEREVVYGGMDGFTVNLTILNASPQSLDPDKFDYTLSIPGGVIVLYNGTRVSSITDSYQSAIIPHWVVVSNGNGIWDGFAGAVKNPDGTPVGMYCSVWPSEACTANDIVQGSLTIDSGATLTILFPTGTSPAGYMVTATYLGYAGNASVVLS